MMKDLLRKSAALAASLACLVSATGSAFANESTVAGIIFRPDVSSNIPSFMQNGNFSWEGENYSSGYMWVSGQIPYQGNHPVYVQGNMSNSTYCYAAVVNGLGSTSWKGASAAGNGGGRANIQISLGTPPDIAATALMVHCYLAPGDTIGLAWQ